MRCVCDRGRTKAKSVEEFHRGERANTNDPVNPRAEGKAAFCGLLSVVLSLRERVRRGEGHWPSDQRGTDQTDALGRPAGRCPSVRVRLTAREMPEDALAARHGHCDPWQTGLRASSSGVGSSPLTQAEGHCPASSWRLDLIAALLAAEGRVRRNTRRLVSELSLS